MDCLDLVHLLVFAHPCSPSGVWQQSVLRDHHASSVDYAHVLPLKSERRAL
jgi:hypothetical protein